MHACVYANVCCYAFVCERTYLSACVCVYERSVRYVVVHLHARAFVRVCVLLCVNIIMRHCISVRSFVQYLVSVFIIVLMLM